MIAEPLRPTFRDPAGSLHLEEHRAVRAIHPDARASVLDFLDSALYQRLQDAGSVLGSTVEEDSSGLRLVHPRIEMAAYPWEWTPSQWLAAAELTLQLCEEAVKAGWILKDATPLNILFVGTRPVLVDVLSFERRQRNTSLWLAYGQYIRTFLLPLIAHQMLGWPLALTLFRRDGYEPSELFALMNWPQRLSRAAFWPVSLPAWLEKRRSGDVSHAPPATAKTADEEAANHILLRMLADLRRRTRRAVRSEAVSEWSEYRGTLQHYSSAESERKRAWVRNALERAQPRRLLDVGANTGEYSFLAAESGIEVVALERDPAAAERLFRMSQGSFPSVLTMQADLARPTPAAGWENSESSALLDRLQGKFDMVWMLAVIHHLLLLEQIPLAAIVSLCARLTTAFLVIEWVPVDDPMFQRLLRGREALYGSLHENDLLRACKDRFDVVQREPLGNGRVLFLFRKIEA